MTTQTPTQTTSKRARKPKSRTATINAAAVLTLTEDGRGETNFHVDRLRSDWGIAWELRKFKAEGGEVYHVCLDPNDPKRSTCDCKGHLRWNHCRHVEALTVLTVAGRMPNLLPV